MNFRLQNNLSSELFSNLATNLAIIGFTETMAKIKIKLEESGISFEGRDIPISFSPTIMYDKEIARVIPQMKLIRKALLKIIERFTSEHTSKQKDGPLHKIFSPYQKWFDIINNERRITDDINLLRFDSIRDTSNNWKILETNTCCPGLVINSAIIRDAWLNTPLIKNQLQGIKYKNYASDSKSGFIEFLINIGQNISQDDCVNIAICNYKNTYTHELESLRKEHERLIRQGSLFNSNLYICDIRDLSYNEITQSIEYKNNKINLIYNKLDPLMIDPNDAQIMNWIKGSQCVGTEYLNSFAAMYLTETKRSLAILHDSYWHKELNLDAETIQAINTIIPRTKILFSHERKTVEQNELLKEVYSNKDNYVLKADALTRGAGIFVGKQLTYKEWDHAINSTILANGIVQTVVDIPTREVINLVKNVDTFALACSEEYFGADFFFFGDEFSGITSRSHSGMVMNVGNGGKISPTLVVSN